MYEFWVSRLNWWETLSSIKIKHPTFLEECILFGFPENIKGSKDETHVIYICISDSSFVSIYTLLVCIHMFILTVSVIGSVLQIFVLCVSRMKICFYVHKYNPLEKHAYWCIQLGKVAFLTITFALSVLYCRHVYGWIAPCSNQNGCHLHIWTLCGYMETVQQIIVGIIDTHMYRIWIRIHVRT